MRRRTSLLPLLHLIARPALQKQHPNSQCCASDAQAVAQPLQEVRCTGEGRREGGTTILQAADQQSRLLMQRGDCGEFVKRRGGGGGGGGD